MSTYTHETPHGIVGGTAVVSLLVMTDQRDTLKMLRETLCVAQSFMQEHGCCRRAGDEAHLERIQRLIDEIDRQRPLGPDGKHGDLHTPTCGCEDR